jgi:hypothetical protein
MNYLKYKPFIEDRFKIIDKGQKEVPFYLNAIQNKFIKDANGWDCILKARQQGFSSLILAIFATDFLTKDNSLSVVVADIADNALDLLGRVKNYIKSYEQITGTKVPLKYNSKYELANSMNGARYIIGTAENSNFGRSKTITNLHMSEAAFYKNFEAMMASAGTALVPDGKFIIETTANGYNDFKRFWDKTVMKETAFQKLFYPARDFYEKDFLLKEKQRLGRLYEQEYPESPEEAFLNSGDMYFDRDALRWYEQHSKNAETENGFRRYREIKSGEFFVVFADTSAGAGDYCAAQFLSKTRLDVPIVYHSKQTATDMTPLLCKELERVCDVTGIPPCVAYERNSGGVFELERLASLNRLGKYSVYQMKAHEGTTKSTADSIKLGWDTNSATRPIMLQMLKEAIDKKLIKLYDKLTINELFSFIIKQTETSWKAQAEVGAHDDLVMSLAGAWQLYQSEVPPLTGEDDNLKSGNLSKLWVG